MQKGSACLRANTPGDSNNNAVVPGSHRAARAVRPFVSRGHSLHYNSKDKAPSGDTEGHGGKEDCSSLHVHLSVIASLQLRRLR